MHLKRGYSWKNTHEAPKAQMLRFHQHPLSLRWGVAWASEHRSVLGNVNGQAGFKTVANLAPYKSASFLEDKE